MAMDPEQRLFGIFKYLFGEWVAEQDYDTEQMQKANAGKFIDWCRANWALKQPELTALVDNMPPGDDDPLATAGKLLDNDWNVWQVLFVWWPILSLAGRQPLQNRPAFLHVSFTFGFPDGRGVQLSIPTQNGGEEHFKHDGYLCALLRSQVERVIESIGEQGLDALYEKFGVPLLSSLPQVPEPPQEAVSIIRRGTPEPEQPGE